MVKHYLQWTFQRSKVANESRLPCEEEEAINYVQKYGFLWTSYVFSSRKSLVFSMAPSRSF